MDKWEDTVISLVEYNRFTKGYYEKQGKAELWCEADTLGAEYKSTLQHQSEISFKAGVESEIDHSAELCAKYLDAAKEEGFKAGEDKGKQEGKQEGFDKVVALLHYDIKRQIDKDGETVIFRVPAEEWQAFLKERGK